MITFVVGVDGDDSGNTQRGERPEDRAVIEFYVCNCYLVQSSWCVWALNPIFLHA